MADQEIIDTPATNELGAQLLSIVQTLSGELRRQKAKIAPGLDSHLDRDLGFDSLSRVELIQRIERAFDVRLPSQLLGQAETPRDLLTALNNAGARRTGVVPQLDSRKPLGTAAGLPDSCHTLPEVLDWHLRVQPDRPHLFLYDEDEEAEVVSYGSLARGAQSFAAGLQDHGIGSGDRVAIMLPTGIDYLHSFFGILLAGAVPVPIYPPVRLSQLEDHLRRHARILDNAGATLMITIPEARNVARALKSLVEGLRAVVTPETLKTTGANFAAVPVDAEDTAFLQYTSGSTGQPKGVVLSHRNLLANIRAMAEAAEADSSDIFVSWLPLYHDMGLIGAWLSSLYLAMPLVLMSPLSFLAHPQRWLWAIHRHRATLSAAPNFAYELCVNKIEKADLEGLDLSSWRLAFNGAEPVSPKTLSKFSSRFSEYGFHPQSLTPVYGLAEAAVGLAFPPLHRGPVIDRVTRDSLISAARAQPATESDLRPLEIVACGLPLPGYQIRVVDNQGRELPERREGKIEFQGPSATIGYFHNREATEALFNGDWLRTGDRGYMVAGEIYLTSRTKDMIIRGGRNLYPYEAEAIVGDIPGIRKGCVAVFGSTDPASGTERVVLVAESHEREETQLESLRDQARDAAGDVLGVPPDEVVIAPPHTVLKTSSGKIRRGAVRDLFESGRIGGRRHAVWRQIARLALASVVPGSRRLYQQLKELLFAGYAHVLFWLLTPPVWLLIVLLPGKTSGWKIMRAGARLLFRLLGIPLKIEGDEHLKGLDNGVMIVNHSSYLDGVVLAAGLPRSFSFIAKKELAEHPVSRLFLERIGALFVERFDRNQSVEDSQRIQRILGKRGLLLYFPEGTFRRAPGLLPFRMGAFTAAASTGAPVIPITLVGTRTILRDESRFPRYAKVSIHIGKPIHPAGDDWKAAIELRDCARTEILKQLSEPDLA